MDFKNTLMLPRTESPIMKPSTVKLMKLLENEGLKTMKHTKPSTQLVVSALTLDGKRFQAKDKDGNVLNMVNDADKEKLAKIADGLDTLIQHDAQVLKNLAKVSLPDVLVLPKAGLLSGNSFFASKANLQRAAMALDSGLQHTLSSVKAEQSTPRQSGPKR